jgi:uncharacterized protein (DUF736 family)
MTTIGTFVRQGDSFTGSIITLTVQARNVRLLPDTTGTTDKSPTHRIHNGDAEIGAAWTSPPKEGKRPSFKVKIDDPSFVAPMYALLVERDDGDYDLIWSRPTKRRDD